LPKGTTAGINYKHPVSLLSLYNTLNELCGLPSHGKDSVSLLPTLKSDKLQFPTALTFLDQRGSVAVSGSEWRYIRYTNGDHELYHIPTDPYEWNNLASKAEHAHHIKRLAATIPTKLAKYVAPSHEALVALKWVPLTGKLPKPSFDGPFYNIIFMNKSKKLKQIHSLEKDGSLKYRATIKVGQKHIQKAEAGSIWVVQAPKGKPAGYFKVLDRAAKAEIR